MSGLPLPEPAAADEDDDGLQDRAALLTPARPRPGRRRPRPRTPHAAAARCLPLGKTLTICLAFFTLGLCIALPGPTLLDLQDQVSVSMAQISQIFFWRALGYLGGSMISGLLFDRLNRLLMMLVSMLLAAAGMATVPWLSSALSINVCFAALGVPLGFVDTGGNVLLLDLWGKSSGPYMQAIHFSFGLGAFAAPLLAVPFIAHTPAANDSTPVLLGRNHLQTARLSPELPADLAGHPTSRPEHQPTSDVTDLVTRPPAGVVTRRPSVQAGDGADRTRFVRLGMALAGGHAAARLRRSAGDREPGRGPGQGPESESVPALERADVTAAEVRKSSVGPESVVFSDGQTGPESEAGVSVQTEQPGGDATELATGADGKREGMASDGDDGSVATGLSVVPSLPVMQNSGLVKTSTDDTAATTMAPLPPKPAENGASAEKITLTGTAPPETTVSVSSSVTSGSDLPRAGSNTSEEVVLDGTPSGNLNLTESPLDGTAVSGALNTSDSTAAAEPARQHAPKPKPAFTDGNKLEHDQTWERPALKPARHPAPAAAAVTHPAAAPGSPTARPDTVEGPAATPGSPTARPDTMGGPAAAPGFPTPRPDTAGGPAAAPGPATARPDTVEGPAAAPGFPTARPDTVEVPAAAPGSPMARPDTVEVPAAAPGSAAARPDTVGGPAAVPGSPTSHPDTVEGPAAAPGFPTARPDTVEPQPISSAALDVITPAPGDGKEGQTPRPASMAGSELSGADGGTGGGMAAGGQGQNGTESNSAAQMAGAAIQAADGEPAGAGADTTTPEGAGGTVSAGKPASSDEVQPVTVSPGEQAMIGSKSSTNFNHIDAGQGVTLASKPGVGSDSSPASEHGHAVSPSVSELSPAGGGSVTARPPLSDQVTDSEPLSSSPAGGSPAGDGAVVAAAGSGHTPETAATQTPRPEPAEVRPAPEPEDGDCPPETAAGTEPGLSVPAVPPTSAVPATSPGVQGTDLSPTAGQEQSGTPGRSDAAESELSPLSSPSVTADLGDQPAQPAAVSPGLPSSESPSPSPSSPSPPPLKPHKPGTYDDTSAEDGLLTRLSSAAAVRGVPPLAQLYLLVSCSLVLVALIFLALLVYDPRARRAAPSSDPGAGPSRCYTAALVSLMAVVLCFYVGMEVAMGQLLMSFSVHSQVHLSRAGGAYVTSVFWGLFASGRALSVCVAGVLRPAAVLAVDYALVTAGSAVLLAAGSWDRTALLLGGALAGLGMASVFPAALVWLEQHVHVSSRLAAVLVVAGALGEMLLPAGVGALMACEPRALVYSLAGCTAVCLLTQAAALVTARLGRPAVGPLEGYQLAAQEEEEDDMVDLSKYPGPEDGGRRLLRM